MIYPESFAILSTAVPGPGCPKGETEVVLVENICSWVIFPDIKPAGKVAKGHLDPST